MSRILLLAVGDPFHRHIDRLKKEGHEVVAIDRDPDAKGSRLADAFIAASADDVDAIISAARSYRVDAIIASSEVGVRAAAEASHKIGLPGLPTDAAWAATDKTEMRKRWQAAALTQPEFEIATTIQAARTAIQRLSLPCVVKPARAWSSKGVSVITTNKDIEPALSEAWAIHSGPLIVERFIPGRLLTAEGFVFDRSAEVVIIGDVETQEVDRFRVNMSLQYPGNFEPGVLAEAVELMQTAALSLNLRRCPFHCECMVGPHGVHLIEMAARGGGGHIFPVLYEQMTGFSGIVHQARLLLKQEIDPVPHNEMRGGCYKFLSAPAGALQQVNGVEDARVMQGVIDCGVAAKPGDQGGTVSNDNARHGHVCTIGRNRDEAYAFAVAAAGRISFVMQSNEPREERFVGLIGKEAEPLDQRR
jgi:biotin carboxylase